MNLVKAFAGVLVPMMATLALVQAPAMAADPAVAPVGTTTTPAPGTAVTKPTTKKPGLRRHRRLGAAARRKVTAAQRAAWRAKHPHARRRGVTPKPAVAPTPKP